MDPWRVFCGIAGFAQPSGGAAQAAPIPIQAGAAKVVPHGTSSGQSQYPSPFKVTIGAGANVDVDFRALPLDGPMVVNQGTTLQNAVEVSALLLWAADDNDGTVTITPSGANPWVGPMGANGSVALLKKEWFGQARVMALSGTNKALNFANSGAAQAIVYGVILARV
jgi:hypothetical protein